VEIRARSSALNEAARRCEAVLFLISKAWLGSAWCKSELNLARRLNKRLFGILIEEGWRSRQHERSSRPLRARKAPLRAK
jgi:TIR domain